LRIAVTSAGLVLTDVVEDEVRRRVLLAVSRFGKEVKGVTVRLTVAKNPLGGVDRRCRLRARLTAGKALSAEAVNGALLTAVGRSAARLARLVAAEFDGSAGRPPWKTGPPGSAE
jgi:hypothetical protein